MKFSKRALLYIAVDVLCCIAAVLLAELLKFDFDFTKMIDYFGRHAELAVIACVIVVALSIIFNSYTSLYLSVGIHDIVRQAVVAFLSINVLFAVKYLMRGVGDIEISGAITVMFGIIYFVLSMFVRGIETIRSIFSQKVSSEKNRRALVVGGGYAGGMLIHMLSTRHEAGLVPVGILDDDVKKHGMNISGVRVLGSVNEAKRWVDKLRAEEIIIAIPSASSENMKRIFGECRAAGVPVKTFGSLTDFKAYISGARGKLRDISVEDLLFRDQISTDMGDVEEYLKDKNVLVTGGAGSIGSEICRQVLRYGCRHLVVMDINENGLFFLKNELLKEFPEERFCVRVGSVRDKLRMTYLFRRHKFDIVFHAAAHKHVPVMEENAFEAVKNNVFGTKNVIECCIENGVSRFVLISTDKAVNPTNVMGATKRAAELLVARYNGRGCELAAVRFGNVLGSNGSVIPIFKKQIEEGGPVTVTHRSIKRYFMTIPEAVSLVLNAGVRAKGGDLFVLDMGEPVNIYDLAVEMITLSGLRVGRDIEIEITGLRPGEKMFEELSLDSESVAKTDHDRIFIMHPEEVDERVDEKLERMSELLAGDTEEQTLRDALFDMISVDYDKSVIRGSNIPEVVK